MSIISELFSSSLTLSLFCLYIRRPQKPSNVSMVVFPHQSRYWPETSLKTANFKATTKKWGNSSGRASFTKLLTFVKVDALN